MNSRSLRSAEVVSQSKLALPTPYEGFRAASERFPDHPALKIGEQEWTYADIARDAGRLANAIKAACTVSDTSTKAGAEIVAVCGARTLPTYTGTLAVFGAGLIHVALNPQHPVQRSSDILHHSGASVVLGGRDTLDMINALSANFDGAFRVILPDLPRNELSSLAPNLKPENTWVAEDIATFDERVEVPIHQPSDLAYLVFTSGSTGQPKGIAISHGNLATYMRNFRRLAAPIHEDRVATTYELTFDIALHDMFNTWWSGATLCVVPARVLMAPGRFIRNEEITYWFSVASSAIFMQRQGVLKPGTFPKLRIGMLCGEALPKKTAEDWAKATPNAELYNVYGPTETTMEIAFYRWSDQYSPAECQRGIVPIGIPFSDHLCVLVDSDGETVEGAGQGELYLHGPQVGPGYWQDGERSRKAFVHLKDRTGIWYKTGDLVERDETGLYHFVSRVDHQIKLRGHRIELGEVEAALRHASGTDLVSVVPYPVIDGVAQGLVGFVPTDVAIDSLQSEMKQQIPSSMIPSRIVPIDRFPLNSNAKIDRAKLIELLQDTE